MTVSLASWRHLVDTSKTFKYEEFDECFMVLGILCVRVCVWGGDSTHVASDH